MQKESADGSCGRHIDVARRRQSAQDVTSPLATTSRPSRSSAPAQPASWPRISCNAPASTSSLLERHARSQMEMLAKAGAIEYRTVELLKSVGIADDLLHFDQHELLLRVPHARGERGVRLRHADR